MQRISMDKVSLPFFCIPAFWMLTCPDVAFASDFENPFAPKSPVAIALDSMVSGFSGIVEFANTPLGKIYELSILLTVGLIAAGFVWKFFLRLVDQGIYLFLPEKEFTEDELRKKRSGEYMEWMRDKDRKQWNINPKSVEFLSMMSTDWDDDLSPDDRIMDYLRRVSDGELQYGEYRRREKITVAQKDEEINMDEDYMEYIREMMMEEMG